MLQGNTATHTLMFSLGQTDVKKFVDIFDNKCKVCVFAQQITGSPLHTNAVTMNARNFQTGFRDPIILTMITAYSHLVHKSLIFHTALYYVTSLYVQHLQVFTLYLLCIRHCHCYIQAGLCLT